MQVKELLRGRREIVRAYGQVGILTLPALDHLDQEEELLFGREDDAGVGLIQERVDE